MDKAGIFFGRGESREADGGQEVFERLRGGHHVGGDGVGVEDLVALKQRPLTIREGHLEAEGRPAIYSDMGILNQKRWRNRRARRDEYTSEAKTDARFQEAAERPTSWDQCGAQGQQYHGVERGDLWA